MMSWQPYGIPLVRRMTAVEASRSFAELLVRVAFGEEIEITQAGATVAVIGPPQPPMFLSPERFKALIGSLELDDDFAKAVEEARREANATMPESPWDS